MAKQERALRTREALITSAATVFDRDGFSTASLSAISARAGVSAGALHFHFASKAALAGAVEDAAARRLETLTRAHHGPAGNTLQRLVNASHELARGLAGDVVLRAGFDLSGHRIRREGRDLRRQWQGWVEETLERAAREGLLNTVTPEQVASAVVAATTGFEVLGTQDPEWLAPRTITRFWQLLLPRLAAADRLGGKLRLGEVGGIPVDVGAEAVFVQQPAVLDLARHAGL
ncbi:ScbR family autoregulator-binding transcription factor, partial [Streptomyces sp. GC420]|uniref:ScbR family autoregulator-binding transcription factor n=1 Tax=Streptomyces sp. GC420 TaxID=2697568 RepID=UPI0014152C95